MSGIVEPMTTDVMDVRWAQLCSHHARQVLLGAAECSQRKPIPDCLLQRATGLPPEAYCAARDLLEHLGLLRLHAAGSEITPQVAVHVRQAAGKSGAAGLLPAVIQAATHFTSEALLSRPPRLADPVWHHAEFLCWRALRTGLPELRNLWYNIACYRLETGGRERAAEAFWQVLVLDREWHGFDHPVLAASALNYAEMMVGLPCRGRVPQLLERGAHVAARCYGPDHRRARRLAVRLGARRTRLWCNELPTEGSPAALVDDLRLLAGMRAGLAWAKTGGPQQESPGLTSLEALGRLVACYRRAAATDEQLRRQVHTEVGIRFSKLGGELWDAGDLMSALTCFNRATAIFEHWLPTKHPQRCQIRTKLDALRSSLRGEGDQCVVPSDEAATVTRI